MGDGTLTHKDLAARLVVSETTIKSYRRKFPEFIPVHSRGKPLHFPPEALKVCLFIRACFQRDLSVEETRSRLAANFPILPIIESDPLSADSPSQQPEIVQLSPAHEPEALDALRRQWQNMAEAQAETNQRLLKLHELFADYLTLHLGREDTFSRGVEQLQHAWDAQLASLHKALAPLAHKSPPAALSPAPTRKRVRVRNVFGDTHEYLFETVTETTPEPSSGSGQAPPDAFLRLPLVVRSEMGEYLGIAGRAERAFCLNDFLGLLGKSYPPPRQFTCLWTPRLSGWELDLEQSQAVRPERFQLLLEPEFTPKGNQVALLAKLDIDGKDIPTPNLYAFIRRMKAIVENM